MSGTANVFGEDDFLAKTVPEKMVALKKLEGRIAAGGDTSCQSFGDEAQRLIRLVTFLETPSQLRVIAIRCVLGLGAEEQLVAEVKKLLRQMVSISVSAALQDLLLMAAGVEMMNQLSEDLVLYIQHHMELCISQFVEVQTASDTVSVERSCQLCVRLLLPIIQAGVLASLGAGVHAGMLSVQRLLWRVVTLPQLSWDIRLAAAICYVHLCQLNDRDGSAVWLNQLLRDISDVNLRVAVRLAVVSGLISALPAHLLHSWTSAGPAQGGPSSPAISTTVVHWLADWLVCQGLGGMESDLLPGMGRALVSVLPRLEESVVATTSSDIIASDVTSLGQPVASSAATASPSEDHQPVASVSPAHGAATTLRDRLLALVWLLMTDQTQSVRLIGKHLFDAVIAVFPDPDFVRHLVSEVLSMPSHLQCRYRCLLSLVSAAGVDVITGDPSLPAHLVTAIHDSSLAPHVVELYCRLLRSDDLPTSDWLDRWMRPLFPRVDDADAIIPLPYLNEILQALTQFDRGRHALLYILQRCHDSSVDCKERPTRPLYILYLAAAHTARMAMSAGVAHEDVKRYMPSVAIMNSALRHHDTQVRLTAARLICDSRKTSEYFTTQDLRLLLQYIANNLTMQAPGQRQQLYAQLTKVLLRLRDGYSAARRRLVASNTKKRQLTAAGVADAVEADVDLAAAIVPELYCCFLQRLFQLLVESLFPKANFPRRCTALRLLKVLDETSESETWLSVSDLWTSVHVRALIGCLCDSYEVNKQIALQLLRRRRTLLLELPTGDIRSLLRLALQYASSARPPDPVTASYLLQFLLLLPTGCPSHAALGQLLAQTAAQDRALRTDSVGGVARDPVEDVATDPVEDGAVGCTLRLMLRLLICRLDREVSLAEQCITQAALQAPMHGLLLCVRHVVQLSSCDGDGQALRLAVVDEYADVILRLCRAASSAALPVVGSASPEGHLPMDRTPTTAADLWTRGNCDGSAPLTCENLTGDDMSTSERGVMDTDGGDQVEDDDGGDEVEDADGGSGDHMTEDVFVGGSRAVTAQTLLICCWRTVKEASLLMGEVVSCLVHRSTRTSGAAAGVPADGDDGSSAVLKRRVLSAGDQLILLLTESKHRGAFEQAAVGLYTVCSALWSCPLLELSQLPDRWLLTAIDSASAARTLQLSDAAACPTRRSAGLPLMVQALLTSAPPSGLADKLQLSIRPLLALASSSSAAAVVHALNVLRALFRDARLGDSVAPYIADAMSTALLRFRSHEPAVRNSASLLYSALTIRVFGVQRCRQALSKNNCMTSRMFFHRFPSLYQLLLDQLASPPADGAHVVPILLLLSRLYPSLESDRAATTQYSLSGFLSHLRALSMSRVLVVRQLAARVVVAFTMHSHRHFYGQQLVGALEEVVDHDASGRRAQLAQNSLHGCLLQLEEILTSAAVHNDDWLANSAVADDSAARHWTSVLRRCLHVLSSIIAGSSDACAVNRATACRICLVALQATRQSTEDWRWAVSRLTSSALASLDLNKDSAGCMYGLDQLHSAAVQLVWATGARWQLSVDQLSTHDALQSHVDMIVEHFRVGRASSDSAGALLDRERISESMEAYHVTADGTDLTDESWRLRTADGLLDCLLSGRTQSSVVPGLLKAVRRLHVGLSPRWLRAVCDVIPIVAAAAGGSASSVVSANDLTEGFEQLCGSLNRSDAALSSFLILCLHGVNSDAGHIVQCCGAELTEVTLAAASISSSDSLRQASCLLCCALLELRNSYLSVSSELHLWKALLLLLMDDEQDVRCIAEGFLETTERPAIYSSTISRANGASDISGFSLPTVNELSRGSCVLYSAVDLFCAHMSVRDLSACISALIDWIFLDDDTNSSAIYSHATQMGEVDEDTVFDKSDSNGFSEPLHLIRAASCALSGLLSTLSQPPDTLFVCLNYSSDAPLATSIGRTRKLSVKELCRIVALQSSYLLKRLSSDDVTQQLSAAVPQVDDVKQQPSAAARLIDDVTQLQLLRRLCVLKHFSTSQYAEVLKRCQRSGFVLHV